MINSSKIKNKIDLHLHIDGSVYPKTVYELSRKHHIEPECHMTLEEIAKSMAIQPGTFDPDFLTFNPPLRVMQTEDALQRITKELVLRLEEEGLIYAELRFAPQFHTEKGLSQKDIVEAVIQGLNEGLSECARLKAQLILCTMNTGSPADNHKENLETVYLAKEYLDKGVCAIDMAGYEENMPDYLDLFLLADKLGVPTTAHSEFTVTDALCYNTSRIGHGYQAALLPELTEKVIEKGITLEMCPKSSLMYDYGLTCDETHPLRKLFLAGARVTVNTDNLTVLNTSLEEEYMLCRKMGFTDDEIIQMNNYAIEAAFLSPEEKSELLSLQTF